MTNILILHGVNYYNAGDHGIALSMFRTIHDSFPGAQVAVTSPFLSRTRTDQDFVARTREGFEDSYPEEIPDLYQVPVGRRRKAQVLLFAVKLLFYGIALTLLPYQLRVPLARTTKFGAAVLNADLVLSKGGGFLLDRGTTYNIPTHLVTIWISVLLRKKTVIYAQSIGPFENRVGRAIAGFVLRRVTRILARDAYSVDYVQAVLGVQADKVRLTADSAFELSSALQDGTASASASVEAGTGTGAGAGARRARRGEVCITLVAPRYSGLPGHEAEATYCAIIAKVIEALVVWGYEVLLIPHLESGAHSDRILAKRVSDLCAPEIRDRIEIFAPTNPINIIKRMARCDFGLCSRMHSMIFAIDANLPFVALSYLPKSDSMLAEAGLDDWRLSLPDLASDHVSTSSAKIIEKLEAMRAELAKSREKVRAAQTFFQGRARNNPEVLLNLLGGAAPPPMPHAPKPHTTGD